MAHLNTTIAHAPVQTPTRVPNTRVLRSINPFVATILRSPLHGLLSQRVLLFTFTGRLTGKAFTIPVEYTRERETLTIFCSHAWWKNLRGGARVSVRLQGHQCTGRAEPIEDPGSVLAAVEQLVALYGRKQAGRRIGIRLDTIPPPSSDELALAMQGRVVIRLTLDHTPPMSALGGGAGIRP
jgi:hypothetical protein